MAAPDGTGSKAGRVPAHHRGPKSRGASGSVAMELPLRVLLEKYCVDRRVTEWMERPPQKCRTLEVFANWVNDEKDLFGEIQKTILDHTELRESRFQRCALVQAWREAEAYAASVLEQAAGNPGGETRKPPPGDAQSDAT